MGVYRFPSRYDYPAFLHADICACIVQCQQQLSALHYSPLEMHLAPGTHVVDQTNTIRVSTRWHRAHGRQAQRQRAERQQLLIPQQEKALVDHLLRLRKNGYPARVEHLRYFAWIVLRHRYARLFPQPCNASSQQSVENILRDCMVDLYALVRGPVVPNLDLNNLLPSALPNGPVDLQSLPFCYVVDDDPRRKSVRCRFRGGCSRMEGGRLVITEACNVAVAQGHHAIIYPLLVSLLATYN